MYRALFEADSPLLTMAYNKLTQDGDVVTHINIDDFLSTPKKRTYTVVHMMNFVYNIYNRPQHCGVENKKYQKRSKEDNVPSFDPKTAFCNLCQCLSLKTSQKLITEAIEKAVHSRFSHLRQAVMMSAEERSQYREMLETDSALRYILQYLDRVLVGERHHTKAKPKSETKKERKGLLDWLT